MFTSPIIGMINKNLFPIAQNRATYMMVTFNFFILVVVLRLSFSVFFFFSFFFLDMKYLMPTGRPVRKTETT